MTETKAFTPERLNELEQIAKALAEQDNLGTSQPVFAVEQRRRVYGFDPNYAEDVTWITSDDYVEAEGDEAEDLEAAYQQTLREPDNWTRTAYQDHWEFVTACLTRAGAEQFIARQRHNLKDPRVYVHSGYRNQEWITLRASLPALLSEVRALRERVGRLEALARELPQEYFLGAPRMPGGAFVTTERIVSVRWLDGVMELLAALSPSSTAKEPTL